MKVFIHRSEMAQNNPQVLASYPDDSEVADSAHGTGVMVFTVSADALTQKEVGGMRVQALAGDWRQRSEQANVLTMRERVNMLHELLQLVIKHGADTKQWPAPDRERHVVILKRWAP
jgi:hypothetical protein